MSELLDKQVNAQKESLIKNFQGSCRFPQAHEKVCNENERRRKHLKYFWWKEGVYNEYRYQMTSGQRFLILIHWSYLLSKRVSRCQGDGFSSAGTWTGTINLAIAGT